jgi:hypothetical protein
LKKILAQTEFGTEGKRADFAGESDRKSSEKNNSRPSKKIDRSSKK